MALTRTRTLLFVAAPVSLTACISNGANKPPETIAQSQAPVLGWRLPKTLLDVTVSYTPTDCKLDAQGKPAVSLDIDAAYVGRAVPDMDIGRENGLVRITPGDSTRFWVDRNITYKVYPDRGGLLQSLSSHPVSQVGSIVGNFLTGAIKLAGAVIGVAPPAPLVTSGVLKCGLIHQRLQEIKAIQARIPTEQGKKAEDDALRIRNLKDAMTVTVKRTIDTAVDRPRPDGFLVSIFPPLEKAYSAGWYAGDGAAQDPLHEVRIRLDFNNGALLARCEGPTTACQYKHQLLPENALFRQAAYIPVVAEQAIGAGAYKVLGQPKVLAFGQYGVPRTVPLSVGAFRDTSWQIDFADTGEITGAVFADKAVGVGVSSLFSGGAAAASSLQQLGVKADSQLDSETLRLQAENTAMDAEIKNKQLKAQLELLNAATPQQ